MRTLKVSKRCSQLSAAAAAAVAAAAAACGASDAAIQPDAALIAPSELSSTRFAAAAATRA